MIVTTRSAVPPPGVALSTTSSCSATDTSESRSSRTGIMATGQTTRVTPDELVLDTPRVRGFLDVARVEIASSGSPEEACEAIRPGFADLLADEEWLPPAYQAPVPDSGLGGGIGQWLLYRAANRSLSLFSVVVASGSAARAPAHLASGAVSRYPGATGGG